MRRTILMCLMAVLAEPGLSGAAGPPFVSSVLAAQTGTGTDSLQVRVWLDRGDEPVVEQGDEVRVYYRTNADAYGAIFRIDTDGRAYLAFPQHPDADHFISGGRDYRLLFAESPRWRVGDDPGVGYYFMIASVEPLDFSLFPYDDERGWDLSAVGAVVYEDPYVAIDDYVAAVLPTWDVTPHALDFLEYSVDEEHDYPRFLCYDCHDFRSYGDWDPYAHSCPSYQVVIWDDPYFRPAFRYYGNLVVVARPFGPRPRYGFAPRVRGSAWGPIVRKRAAPPRVVPVFKETARRPVTRSARRPSTGAPPRGTTRRPVVVPRRPRSSPGVLRRTPTSAPTSVRPPATNARPRSTTSRPAVRPSTQRPSAQRPSTGASRPPPPRSAPQATTRPPRRPNARATTRPPQRPNARATTRPPRRPSARPAPGRPTRQPPAARAPARPSPSARPPRSGGSPRPGATPTRARGRSGTPARRPGRGRGG